MSHSVEKLLEMTEEDFAALVRDDLRKDLDSETSQSLRGPEVASRWYQTLVGILRDVDNQFRIRSADLSAKAEGQETAPWTLDLTYNECVREYRRWKPSALRFRGGVLQKVTEARNILLREGKSFEEINDTVGRELYHAIKKHKEHRCTDECDNPRGCTADLALWEVLDEHANLD